MLEHFFKLKYILEFFLVNYIDKPLFLSCADDCAQQYTHLFGSGWRWSLWSLINTVDLVRNNENYNLIFLYEATMYVYCMVPCLGR